ncbi:MAG: terminase small subunit [Rhabdochlamydiaceae bacterium]
MAKLKRASDKEKSFAKEYIKRDGNRIEAVIHSKYTVKNNDRKLASNLGSQLLDKPRVQEEISKILNKAGLDTESLAQDSRRVLEEGLIAKPSFAAAVSHLEFLYKIQGVSPVAKSMKLSLSKTDKMVHEDHETLMEQLNKLQKIVDGLLTYQAK